MNIRQWRQKSRILFRDKVGRRAGRTLGFSLYILTPTLEVEGQRRTPRQRSSFYIEMGNSLGNAILEGKVVVPTQCHSLRILGLAERRPPAWSPLNFSTDAVLGVKYNDLANG